MKHTEQQLKEKKFKEKDKRLYKTYGITYHEWLGRFGSQYGNCAICGCNGLETNLCVDHIHIKGFKDFEPKKKQKYLRGLLCFMCNTALKGFEKTIDGKRNRQQLEKTYKYFQTYKLKGEL